METITLEKAIELSLKHHGAGELPEAESLYRQILKLAPRHAQSWYLLGVIAGQCGKFEEAVKCMTRAIELEPAPAHYHYNLGVAYGDLKRFKEAIACYRKAVELAPEYHEALNNLATRLREEQELEESILLYQRALAIRPDAETHNNLSMALSEAGRHEEAIAGKRAMLAKYPDSAEGHWTLAFNLLTLGQFEEGWREYEWRWKLKRMAGAWRDAEHEWDGSPLNGKTILLYNEQGFGDAIQFVRYVPMVLERGGRIVLQCRPQLYRLFQSVAGVELIDTEDPAPKYDVCCPMMSLPRVFKANLASIPAPVSYLAPPRELAAAWRQKLGDARGKLRVGLAWSGSPTHNRDHLRSLPVDMLAPLAAVQNVEFFSLNKNPVVGALPEGLKLIDHTSHLVDFADTAALMQCMDLVISVDTSVLHLSAALGRPTWGLIPFWPDWRWFTGRSDSPWYPTLRLFRQPKAGDWDTVIRQIVDALEQKSKSH